MFQQNEIQRHRYGDGNMMFLFKLAIFILRSGSKSNNLIMAIRRWCNTVSVSGLAGIMWRKCMEAIDGGQTQGALANNENFSWFMSSFSELGLTRINSCHTDRPNKFLHMTRNVTVPKSKICLGSTFGMSKFHRKICFKMRTTCTLVDENVHFQSISVLLYRDHRRPLEVICLWQPHIKIFPTDRGIQSILPPWIMI